MYKVKSEIGISIYQYILFVFFLNVNTFLNFMQSTGRQYIHYAAKGGSTEVVTRLLELGADINEKDKVMTGGSISYLFLLNNKLYYT